MYDSKQESNLPELVTLSNHTRGLLLRIYTSGTQEHFNKQDPNMWVRELGNVI